MWLTIARPSAVFSAGLLLVGVIAALAFSFRPSQVGAQDRAKTKASAPAAPTDPRSKDRAAVRAAMVSFAKAFASRDAGTLAAHFTAEGELHNAQGLTVRGRESLAQGFTAFFAKTPEVTAEVLPEALRFLSADTAIEEGEVSVRRGPTAQAKKAHYSALFAREDGQWRLAQLSESDPPAEEVSISDLGWLIGEWKSTSGGGGAEIRTTYSWDANKKFIHVRFTIKEKELALSGSQVIGVDPATGRIHSWIFEADGGVGEADWQRDGDHWELAADGTLADGTTLTETNVLRRVNDDNFTFQSVDRLLDDGDLPDLAPVKVTRIKPTK